MFKTISMLTLVSAFSTPNAHWDECKDQSCYGIEKGWMCCDVTYQNFLDGDIVLDVGYTQICTSPEALNIVPVGVKNDFVQGGDTFFCSQKHHDAYAKALMQNAKSSRQTEGLIVSGIVGGSTLAVIGFAAWAYYMFAM